MWGLVSPDNQVDREESNIDPNVATKPGWYWFPIVEIPTPVYNPKTQLIEGPKFNIFAETIEKYWTVRDKTQEEIEYDKQTILSTLSQTVIDILFYQENKIRILQNQPELTKDQFVNYIKSII